MAILAADVVGYEGPKAGLGVAILSEFGQVFARHVDQHHGCRLNTRPETTFLATFPSALEGVGCAVGLQRDLADRSNTVPSTRQMRLCIGVNHEGLSTRGEASASDEDSSVVRLVALAEPGGICISRTVYDEVRYQLELQYDTKRDSKHTAFVCQEIRLKWSELNLLESSAVRINPAALVGESGNIATARGRREAMHLVHRVKRLFGRKGARLMGGERRR